MAAFERWADGQPGTVEVRELEHRADDARKAVQREVQAAFVSEISPENAFDLSQRLDEIINAAKNLVREAEVLAMPPDPPISDMAHLACEGVKALVTAIGKLGDSQGATEGADAGSRPSAGSSTSTVGQCPTSWRSTTSGR